MTEGDEHRPLWEVYSDEHGNMYFYNTRTGETAWELPTDNRTDESIPTETTTATGETLVSNALCDDDGNRLELTVIRPKGGVSSPYQIAVQVIETMLALMDAVLLLATPTTTKKKRFVSLAAEKRATKNNEIQQKRHKRERLLAMTLYMNILIPRTPTSSGLAATEGKRPVGALFTREDVYKWRVEKEILQIRQRYKMRKQKDKHHHQVYARAMHDQFLKQFRTELLKYFITQIPCSSELQQQRILLLTSPQQLAEMELQRKATLEPELLERYETEKRSREETMVKNIQKVFVLADRRAVGSLHLLQALFTIFSDERAQKFAVQVRGLSELVNSAEIQRFVVDFVSSHQPKNATLSLAECHYFVKTIEEVLEHYEGVKAAVKDAEEEIATAIEATNNGTGSSSLLRARLNMVSTKKAEQEMAALRAIQSELESKKKQEISPPFYDCSDSLLLAMAKEEWEKHHQHRYIQLDKDLPIYCCLCRRRKWELWRKEVEQEESDYREMYSNRYKLKMKSEELRLIREQEHDPNNDHGGDVVDVRPELPLTQSTTVPIPGTICQTDEEDNLFSTFVPRDDDQRIVLQVIRTLVVITERIHSEDAVKAPPQKLEHQERRPAKQLQTGSPKKKRKKKAQRATNYANEEEELDELQIAMKVFEAEDREHRLMVNEDSSMHIFLERKRRHLERPLLLREDAAHNAYVRLISHCVNPSSLLYRLQVERCLTFEPPQHLVMLMMDAGITLRNGLSRRLILHTVPCRTDQEATFIHQQMKSAQDNLKNQFVASLSSTAKHTYQFFSESGNLIECWPVVFVAVEYFVHGSWDEAYRRAIADKTIASFSQAEARIVRTFRDVAAGLAAMHSNGMLHLNFNLRNLYLRAPMDITRIDEIQIGGFLACKRGFHEGHLRSGDMVHCLNPVIAPPEATNGHPVTGKADTWMLGCALYEALMIWQTHELNQLGIGSNVSTSPTTVLRLKTMMDVFQEIPLATSASVRSLLRMLLQPNPSQRPYMSQVVDILTFAGKKMSSK